MHWVTVEQLKLPVCIGGHAALDFCNTRTGWGESAERQWEWLRSYDHLALWAWHAGLIAEHDAVRLRRSAARDSASATAVLTDARRLRRGLRTAVLEPENGRAIGTVTGYLRKAAQRERLRPGRMPHREIPASTGLELPLLIVAKAAGDFLTSDDIAHVHACHGDGCTWLFIDRIGWRRWCSMSACGNREKARAYAKRHRR